MKDCLIRRWAAEGLLPRRDTEKGEVYFKELITRRLIQPVFDDNDDQEVGCTVHGVIHEFITSLSREENFVTAGAMLRSESFPCDTIRRVSVDCNKLQDASDILKSCSLQLRQMRSLTILRGIKRIPDLSAFKLWRVLDIQVRTTHQHLERIGRLPLLTYLGLRGYGDIRVPEVIGQPEHLPNLYVGGKWRCIHAASPNMSPILETTSIMDLAPFTDMKLMSLHADDVELPHGISSLMQELEELSTIHLESRSSLDATSEIVSNSMELRMLGLRFKCASGYEIYREGLIHLLEVLAASSLQSLFLDCGPCSTSLDILLEYWNPTRLDHLRKFVLRATCASLQEIPLKMASLVQLTHLHIVLESIEAQGLHVLGNLPNLVLLDIRISSGFKGRCTISSGAFRCLKVFWFEFSDTGGMWLQLNEGAMPQLRKLRIRLRASGMKYCRGDLDFGIHHLSSVAEVRAIIDCSTATPPEVEALEAAITKLVSEIPRDIMLEFSREFGHPMVNEEEAGGVSLGGKE